MDNFICSAAEAIAGRILKTRDPALAGLALKMSAADWQFAVDSNRGRDQAHIRLPALISPTSPGLRC